MNSPLIRKILGIGIGGALVISALAGVATGLVAYATSPSGTPDVQIRIGDDMNDSTPELPQDCPRDMSAWRGHGEGVAYFSTGGANDSDCIQVRILNHSPSTQYTRDFKLCLGIPYNMTCTPWASEGGGLSGQVSNGTGNIKGAQIWVVDRNMPIAGMKMDNVQAGVQYFYQKDNNACRGTSGMVWSGGPESGWAYGEHRDNDPGCARIGLSVRQVLPPNAQYVADTVPRSADASSTYQAAITMRNKGLTWNSDGIAVPERNNCANSVPNNGDICYDSYVVQSSNFVLRRIDQTAQLIAPATLPYKRNINVTYERAIGEECEFEPGGGGCGNGGNNPNQTNNMRRSLMSSALGVAVPTALALPCGPGGGGGTTVCTQYNYVNRFEVPLRDVYLDATTDFPITVTTPGEPGIYTLRYQMVQVGGGNQPNEQFGDIVEIPITVGDSNPGIGLSCTTLSRTVQPGDPADFAFSVSGTGGFSGQVTVGVSSALPAGVTAASTTLTLPPTPRNGLVVLMTSGSTPSGTYPITLRATAQGVQPRDCQAELIVTGGGATLTVAPPSQRIGIGQFGQFTATYDPDGPSGPQQPYGVTAPADWWSDVPAVATATGPGTFRGTATGTTVIWAGYAGLQASAVLEVRNCPPSGCIEDGYVEIVPSSAFTNVGAEVSVRAYYYPGGQAVGNGVDVTADSYWASGSNAIATVAGDGRYRGVAVGNTTMHASYPIPGTNPVQYLAATGDLEVRNPGDASLTIEPFSREIQVGSTASYAAWYDPDGNGPAPRQNVTGSANWDGDSFVTHQGNGAFRGDSPGNGSVYANYGGEFASAGITVTGTPGLCTFSASPNRLFIPPPRSTTLPWQCQQPTSCTIRVNGGPRNGQVIATGGQNGSGQDQPPYSTTYRLNCDNGFQQDVRVRVFNVSTRIEILPQ